MRKVSKRDYPDYYELIKQPIALEDIKKKLDHHEYPSLQTVRNDFELLFANAKQYNQTESAIFQDAKELWVRLSLLQMWISAFAISATTSWKLISVVCLETGPKNVQQTGAKRRRE